jgi:hypothetical protein
MLRFAALTASCAAVLAACGGGGGGTGGTTSQPLPQSIGFADAGPLYKFLGDAPYTDAASGGQGSGEVTYVSDTPTVATVDQASGMVTIQGAGVASITATKGADTVYASAQATYSVRVSPKSVAVLAWVGQSDTQVQFPAIPLQLDFIRTFDPSCDPTVSADCANGAHDPVTSSFLDTNATLSRPARYWLGHGANYTDAIDVPEQKFGVQIDPGVRC